MKGADGNQYVTIIDDNGQTQYDPLPFDSDSYCSFNGYIFSLDNSYVVTDIIAPDGTRKKIGDNLSDLSEVSYVCKEDLQYSENPYVIKLACADGFFLTHTEASKINYVSVDGQKTINNASASYNKNGDLVYTNKDGKKVANSAKAIQNNAASESGKATSETTLSTETTKPTSSPKSYTNPSSFNIKGKWKNIGEDTYGQAQKGSIVSFDGKNCNFFSPKDTYAFYKDGDDFRLDCTSPLADTVSFTVKIVDNNNIDVMNSYHTVELTRVE